MFTATLCNLCYIVVCCGLLVYVFWQKVLQYLNNFTNLITATRSLSAIAELLVIQNTHTKYCSRAARARFWSRDSWWYLYKSEKYESVNFNKCHRKNFQQIVMIFNPVAFEKVAILTICNYVRRAFYVPGVIWKSHAIHSHVARKVTTQLPITVMTMLQSCYWQLCDSTLSVFEVAPTIDEASPPARCRRISNSPYAVPTCTLEIAEIRRRILFWQDISIFDWRIRSGWFFLSTSAPLCWEQET